MEVFTAVQNEETQVCEGEEELMPLRSPSCLYPVT